MIIIIIMGNIKEIKLKKLIINKILKQKIYFKKI